MKIITLFNNKGGVGKTTLGYHLAYAFSEMGRKTLMIDLDPQCNLTACSIAEEKLHEIWEQEDGFIEDGFDNTRKTLTANKFNEINTSNRTIHYLLKTTEEGTGDIEQLPPPIKIKQNLDLIPGRLTLHKYENKISERWSGVYQGDPLSIRTINRIREIANDYGRQYNYDYILIDTSPSLGSLNKVIISTADCFFTPCLPDMFSLYGIRNIGNCLEQWKKELNIIFGLISDEKREAFPKEFVRFLGYTIYNAKKYTGQNEWELAIVHKNFAEQIPDTILKYMPEEVIRNIEDILSIPIGITSVMHTHNTFAGMSQKYKVPIWEVPYVSILDSEDRTTIFGNRDKYEGFKKKYIEFAKDVEKRVERLG